MNCDQVQDVLQRYHAGTLSQSMRQVVETHLATCDACRREATLVAPVLSAVAKLPREIEPPVDLWPSLSGRIGRAKLVEGRFGVRPTTQWWNRGAVLAAAAVVLVVISSAITLLITRPRGGSPVAVIPAGVISADFLTVEAQYSRAADEILLALEDGEVRIAPETRAILERNLHVIDQAIAESRAALARDPANRDLKDMLLSTYEHKLDLLRRVTYPKST
jgi:anti-sigma-K factor RskA